MIESMGRHNQRKRTAAATTTTSRARSGNRRARRDRSSNSGGDAWSMYTGGSNSNSSSQQSDDQGEVSSSSEGEEQQQQQEEVVVVEEEFYEDEFYDYENGAQRLSMDQTVVGNRGGAGGGTVGGVVVVDVAAGAGTVTGDDSGDASSSSSAAAGEGETEATLCTMQLPAFSQQFMDGFREQFSQSLRQLLVDRFTGHWYEDDPTRGSGYRAIISDQIQYDTVLLRSLEMCASWVERNMPQSTLLPVHWQSLFVRFLPRNVIMFCNPRRVCVRQLGGARYYQVLNVYLKRQPSSSTYSSPASPMQPARTSTPIIVEPDNASGGGDGTDPDGQHQRVRAIKA